MRRTRIPMFPLDLVLFPGMSLPLHIFEPRYKVMVSHCLEQNLEFGMVLAENKTVASIGCTTEIIKKIKDYPDGRLDIITEGRAVFQLVRVIEEKEYYEGIVEYPPDDDSVQDSKMESHLTGLFQKYRTLLTSEPWIAPEKTSPAGDASKPLSYTMAAALPLDIRDRQALLEMRSEELRRNFLVRWISASIPALAERQRTRSGRGGDGHGPN